MRFAPIRGAAFGVLLDKGFVSALAMHKFPAWVLSTQQFVLRECPLRIVEMLVLNMLTCSCGVLHQLVRSV